MMQMAEDVARQTRGPFSRSANKLFLRIRDVIRNSFADPAARPKLEIW
jgi:hypothetical protein